MARALVLTLLLAACAKPREETVWVTTEGMISPGSPPQMRPARAVDAALLARGKGALVVRVSSVARMQVQLFPNPTWWTDPIRTDSTDVAGRVVLTDLAPREYTGRARRVGLKEQRFSVRITAGYADTLMLNPGTVGQ